MLTIFHKLSNFRAEITENINYIISGYACTDMTMLHRSSLQFHKLFLDNHVFKCMQKALSNSCGTCTQYFA